MCVQEYSQPGFAMDRKMLPQYDALIVGLVGIVFDWTASNDSAVPPSMLKNMLSTTTWQDYERSKISPVTCFYELSARFGVSEEEVANAISETKKSVKVNNDVIALLREIKTAAGSKPKIYAMSNMPSKEFDSVRSLDLDWSVMDDIFISGAISIRKPDIRFFQHVLGRIDSEPRKIVFLDHRLENVLAATSLGMHGLMYEGFEKTKRSLCNLFGDPVQKGKAWLCANAHRLETVTMTGQIVPEWFSAMLVSESTKDQELLRYAMLTRRCNFFSNADIAASHGIPDDTGTTAVAFTVLKDVDQKCIHGIMDEMLHFRNEDGIIQSYYDPARPAVDHVQATHVLTFFHQHGRSHDPKLRPTFDWIHNVLLTRAYLGGSRYYTSAEWFFFALARLIRISDDPQVQATLKPLLRERVQERMGSGGDALMLAMRIVACDVVGIKDMVDLRVLLPLQCEDGGFGVCWLYRMGKTGLRAGNRGLPTALAIEAIKLFAKSE